MFVHKQIQTGVGVRDHVVYLAVDAYVDETLGIATHPIPAFMIMYQRCPQGWMYTTLDHGSVIQVYPMPANKETAIMFAEQMATRGWDDPCELASFWMEKGIGQWVMPAEEVRNA